MDSDRESGGPCLGLNELQQLRLLALSRIAIGGFL